MLIEINMEEVWKKIPGFDDYDVSNLGKVRTWRPRTWNARRRKIPILKKINWSARYGSVDLRREKGVEERRYVHHLVLLAFVGPCPEGMECLHGPRGIMCNHLDNLSWGDPRKNRCEDKGRDGVHGYSSEEQVKAIRLLLREGHSCASIARRFNLHDDTIYKIRDGKTYIMVKDRD